MDANKQEEIIASVLRSIPLSKLYTDLRSNSSNVKIPQDTNICLALFANEIQSSLRKTILKLVLSLRKLSVVALNHN